MTAKENTAAAPTENTTNGSDAAAQNTPAQPLVTIQDLVTLVNFLQDMANMKRLSQTEIQAIDPAFTKVVSFLNAHAQSQAQASAPEPVAQTEETLLDLPTKGKGKKKASKKK